MAVHVASRLLNPWAMDTSVKHFRPQLLRPSRDEGPVVDPHGRQPWPLPVSLLKAVYWLADYSLGYWLRVFRILLRAKLVVFDRYLIDTVVDPKRYRYQGPTWVLRLVSRLVPKPDLVILLDAPEAVLHSRKQEVPIEETIRQRAAYLALVERVPRRSCRRWCPDS